MDTKWGLPTRYDASAAGAKTIVTPIIYKACIPEVVGTYGGRCAITQNGNGTWTISNAGQGAYMWCTAECYN